MPDKNSWSDGFSVATGSVAGREHVRLYRNNQDGLAVRVEPQRIVAAVCDGCSAGRSSEVGARLGAAWIVAQLPRLLDEDPCPLTLADRLATDLLAYLEPIAAGLGAGPRVIHDYLLFTLLVAVVEPERVLVLGLGDGIYAVDDDAHCIDPYPENAPPYLAYRLVDPAHLDRPSAEPLSLHYGTPRADSIVIASDGLMALSNEELSTLAPGCERNPSLLQKRLNMLERRFNDDASVIVIRKRQVAA